MFKGEFSSRNAKYNFKLLDVRPTYTFTELTNKTTDWKLKIESKVL